ncbi:MAG: GNAT family N-acetyltransferase [Chloroflexota bacterium]
MSLQIRPYHPSDLSSLYRICLETADNGGNATHLHSEPDLHGHFYAAPYAVLEPDLCFVLTHNGRPCGYILGARDTATFGKRCEAEWFPPLRESFPLPAPDDNSADANIIRLIHRGHDQTNDPAGYPAHLHIDILPVGQKGGWGRRLMETFWTRLLEVGVTAVHLGVSKNNPNAVGFYKHIGYEVVGEYPTAFLMGIRL